VTPANVGAETRKVYATYESPNHIKFYSYTPTWNKTKLEQLYKVLMHNAHGDEMSLLSRVNVYPDRNPGESGNCQLQWDVDPNGRPTRLLPGRTINLYYGNDMSTPEKMSPVLSHEYGHLFTYYWLIKKEHKLPKDPTTGWAKIRGLKGLPIRFSTSHLPYSHFWQPEEIMANDYYYLFGAPEGKKSVVPDTGYGFSYTDVEENILVSAPESIPALKLYWERLSGIHYNNGDTLTEPHITGIEVTNPEGAPQPVYNVHFTRPSTNPSTHFKYFVLWSDQRQPYGEHDYAFTNMQEDTTTIAVGAVGPDNMYYENPKGKAYLRVFALDEKTNQLVWSPMYWYDFSDPQHPKPIPNQFDLKS
jgi:hypothetical protein